MNFTLRSLCLFIIVCASTVVCAQINPVKDIKWTKLTGSGVPSSGACTSSNYGQPYTDTTNNIEYWCGSGGWFTFGTSIASQYKIHTLGVGLGDGLDVIPAGTYPISFQGKNTFGQTITISSIQCGADTGSTTVNVSDNSGNALLTGAITATSSWAAGTQSTHTTLISNAWTNWTIVADGTTKIVQCVLTGSLP